MTLPSPITRLEKFMSAAAGVSVSKPTPITRVEYLWDKYRTEPEPIPRTIDWTPIIHITDALAKPVVDLKVKITPVQTGTGDPSPENVRPISGWTGANVVRSGKNLFDHSNIYLQDKSINDDGSIVDNANYDIYRLVIVTNGICSFRDSRVSAGTKALRVAYHGENGGYISQDYLAYSDASEGVSFSINPPSNANYALVSARKTIFDVQIETGSQATAYSPYTGTTYPITWQTEAGTVYGGELDVTTGLLTVTMAEVDLGSFDWVSESEYVIGQFLVNQWQTAALGVRYSQVVCSILKGTQPKGYKQFEYGEIGLSNSPALQILRARTALFDEATPADVKTFFAGQTLVYELATPQTYQLTPTEVTTLLGVNNIWADTGDSKLTYLANPDSPEPVQATRALRTLATEPVVEETETEPEETPEDEER